MKNFKIGGKIWIGFASLLIFLLAIAAASILSSVNTGSNIDEIEVYGSLQNSANELIHILNETRITAAVFYETHSPTSFSNLNKQLTYCDFRLSKLHETLKAHPELASLADPVADFDRLYTGWRTGVARLGSDYPLDEGLSAKERESFAAAAADLSRSNLLAHEILSNTINDIDRISRRKTAATKEFHTLALGAVIALSALALPAAALLSAVIIRSVTTPMNAMRRVLHQMGQTGDLSLSEETESRLTALTAGKDEFAACITELMALVKRLHEIDKLLSYVALGDLTARVRLQSGDDTMGLAVETMLTNLNQKFGTIARSAVKVKEKAEELSRGSQMLSDGSKSQEESVEQLSGSVGQIVGNIQKNRDLAEQTTRLVNDIQQSADAGAEQMRQMTAAAADINDASRAISEVIRVINDIASQTNTLALNAAVEAARAGHHGKGFSIVAGEVRDLANKSAEAAKDTERLIESTMEKAALGATIAKTASGSFRRIVEGVEKSSLLIHQMSALSQEQSQGLQLIRHNVNHVERIVEQNNTIAFQSTDAAGEISAQSNLLNELVEQFRLMEDSGQRALPHYRGGRT